MKYMVLIEKGEKGYGAYVPDLPGCIAAADTEEEVKQLIKEAIEFHIEGLRGSGRAYSCAFLRKHLCRGRGCRLTNKDWCNLQGRFNPVFKKSGLGTGSLNIKGMAFREAGGEGGGVWPVAPSSLPNTFAPKP